LSAALLAQLNKGIEAMGIVLPESAPQQLIEYLDLLNRWNKSFNLTAIRNPEEMISKHLLDSLAVLPFVGKGRVADVGSGAGLPGIPLALARPDVAFVLVDSNGKKTSFLNQVKIVLGLNHVEIVNQRIEDYRPDIYFDSVIARAYANTGDIIESTSHLHKNGTRILVMQGKLDEAVNMPGYDLKQSQRLNVYGLEAERHLLEIVMAGNVMTGNN
jgi:16S rRNA (guanine527-N7)-methyltransferase